MLMNTDTGVISLHNEIERMAKEKRAKYVPIDEQLMTLKQKQNMQVSKFDNRSPLAKIKVQHRNSIRNRPCPCGSNLKFKKCCWSKTE